MPSDVDRPPATPAWASIAKGLMRDQGITQEDLLPVMEVETRGAIGHYFTGRRDPTIQQLMALAKKLGVTTSQLVGEDPILPDPEGRSEAYALLRQAGQDQMPLLLRVLRAALPPDDETSAKKRR